jgi:glutathione synthase/RimK-type ligase-like ATP-grasp enzyme
VPDRPRIAIATCSLFPELEADDRLLLPALADLGIDAEPMIWDEAFTDWGAFDLVLVRSTWDYVGRREEYLTWARSVPRLINPAPVLEWSTDKRYLEDLRAAGLPIVPTLFLEDGARFPLLEAEVVVKPTESAGSRDTQRFNAKTEKDAVALMRRIHASGRTAMVQPYLREVEHGRGETALLYLGGAFSHAIHKGPLLVPDVVRTALYTEETIAPREATAAERGVGDAVMAWLSERFGPLAYARIDVLPAFGGHLVLEVELAEPSLFLAHEPRAPARLAAAIAAAL